MKQSDPILLWNVIKRVPYVTIRKGLTAQDVHECYARYNAQVDATRIFLLRVLGRPWFLAHVYRKREVIFGLHFYVFGEKKRKWVFFYINSTFERNNFN